METANGGWHRVRNLKTKNEVKLSAFRYFVVNFNCILHVDVNRCSGKSPLISIRIEHSFSKCLLDAVTSITNGLIDMHAYKKKKKNIN